MPAKNKLLALSCLGILLWVSVAWLFIVRPVSIIEILPDMLPLSVFSFLLFSLGLLILCAVATSIFRHIRPPNVRKIIFFFALLLVLYNLSPLAPEWKCFGKRLYVRYANAAGQNCTTTCTNNKAKPCSGWSSCWDKNISCSSSGIDQDGRNCNGCCFSCSIICENPNPPVNQPPSVTGTLTCSQMGDNGWCIGKSTLNLSASDPQNYGLTISGTIAGIPFICTPGNACSKELPEGSGVVTYQAVATSGLTSSTLSTSWMRDITASNISTVYPSIDGSNNWHMTSPVAVSVSASDDLSGLRNARLSVNGGAWLTNAYLSDGVYSVDFRAVDNAGNLTTITRTIKVDSTAPTVKPIIPAPDGQNDWFRTAPVDISAEGSDIGSGLASTLISIDGGPLQTGMVLSDGIHTVSFTSTDNAGNTATVTRMIKVDAGVPEISTSISGTEGKAGWYISPTFTRISATELSGIDYVEYNQNGSGWKAGTSIESKEGINTIDIRVYDVAGNNATKSIVIKIDTTPPTIGTSTDGTHGLSNWYVSQARTNITASDETSGVGQIEHNEDAAGWQSGSSVMSDDGIHDLNIRVFDVAGNMSEKSLQINVDTIAPLVIPIIPVPDGQNNWFVSSPVHLSAKGEDLGSGLAETSVSANNTDWLSNASLLDGVYTVTFKAIDKAGNFSTESKPVKIDTIAPSLSTSIDGIAGNSGWYVSQTNTMIIATDKTSGILETQYNQNKEGWKDGTSFLSVDGVNQISIQTFDLAGNIATASLEIKVDTEKPDSKFTSPTNGSTETLIRGSYSLVGVSSDITSGVAAAEISLDGESWLPIQLYTSNNSWTYDWDTTTWTDGLYPVTVRTTDMAGNKELVEAGARVTLVVNNSPPHITLTAAWFVWQAGLLSIKTDYFPVRDGMIVISDPDGPWSKIEIPFGEKYPAEIRWDRHFANGISAPPGDYRVSVLACNVHDLCSEKSAVIKIPWYAAALLPVSVPTNMAEVEPEKPQMEEPYEPSVTPVAELPVLNTEPLTETKLNDGPRLTVLSIIVIVALMWAIASAALADKRPKAIRAIAKTLNFQYYKGECNYE